VAGTGNCTTPTTIGYLSGVTSNIQTQLTSTTNASNLSSGTVPSAQLPTASTSVLGAVKVDGSTITIASGVISSTVGGATATYYTSPFFGATSLSLAATAGHIQGFGFTVPTNVTFSNIYLFAATVDATAESTVAIANSSGTLVCHPTTALAVPSSGSIFTNACSEGSVTLSAGATYILLTTSAATTGQVKATSVNQIIGQYTNSNVTGCTSSSGVISGTCSITLAGGTGYGQGFPNFALH
jgi:hypothetical protein